MTYPNGKVYEGHWVYKRRHGAGTLYKKGKEILKGRWVNNMILNSGNKHEESWTVIDNNVEECKESEYNNYRIKS